ncbi:hypothetical protein NECAME_09517 [Necator americanus]|uniref:DUF4139 domain-containing protein n=1 Tax=Necator americanus TaxID=51031 RepID=W2TFX2_NECAM|nr:hypothetical protein NECAME_09517 [Necator americanus]ETN79907.1 hypothetical protein NECAME_09517 [Necator americanus]
MENAGAVELFVSYQVYCASWKPAYDIRAVTTAEGEQENSIKLCYYGLVEQNTGDDWIDTDMVLSTASPSIGGCAPQLDGEPLSILERTQYHEHHYHKMGYSRDK